MGELERAVRAEIESWGSPLTGSALAACSIDLAMRLDHEPRSSEAAQLHGRLHSCLSELRKLAPPAMTSDDVDEVTEQREKRLRAAGLA